jgi:hypothetical protein
MDRGESAHGNLDACLQSSLPLRTVKVSILGSDSFLLFAGTLVMCKHRLHVCNDVRPIFCGVFLIVQFSAFAQPEAKGADTGIHEVTGNAANTASWESRELADIRLRFKLPGGYKEKHWAVVVGSPGFIATFQLGHLNQIDFKVRNVENANLEAAVMPQRDYVDYKEWSQLIGGRKGIVQTFQGGMIFDEKGQRLAYCVEAICALDGKSLLWVSATLGNQERQREVLAMLKTIEFH